MGKPQPLLTTAELAEWLNKPPMTLAIWRSKRLGPPYLKLENGSIRYDLATVQEWLRQQSVPA